MAFNFNIVRVNPEYCNYLRKFDSKVIYNDKDKELRPFIGILFEINNCEYFAPLASPKAKHKKMKNTIDFCKIKDGELGAVNFNNMIPVTKSNYYLIDLNGKLSRLEDIKYQKLLKEQLDWLNSNYDQVKNRSLKLYTLYVNNRLPDNIMARCCNFSLLEEKCKRYNKNK